MTRTGTLALGGLCIVSTVLYVTLGYLPSRRAVASMRAEQTRKQALIDRSPQLAVEIAELQDRMRATEQLVDAWHAAAPGPEQLSEVLSSLTLAAASSGAELVSLQPQPPNQLAVIRRDQIQLELTGTLAEIHGFLQRVEEGPQSIWIDRLEIAGPSEDGVSLRCELSLSIFGDLADISD